MNKQEMQIWKEKREREAREVYQKRQEALKNCKIVIDQKQAVETVYQLADYYVHAIMYIAMKTGVTASIKLHPMLKDRTVRYVNFMGDSKNDGWMVPHTEYDASSLTEQIVSMLNSVQPQAIVQLIDGVFSRPTALNVSNEYYAKKLIEATKLERWSAFKSIGEEMKHAKIRRELSDKKCP